MGSKRREEQYRKKIVENLKENDDNEPKKVQFFQNYAKKYKRIYPSPQKPVESLQIDQSKYKTLNNKIKGLLQMNQKKNRSVSFNEQAMSPENNSPPKTKSSLDLKNLSPIRKSNQIGYFNNNSLFKNDENVFLPKIQAMRKKGNSIVQRNNPGNEFQEPKLINRKLMFALIEKQQKSQSQSPKKCFVQEEKQDENKTYLGIEKEFKRKDSLFNIFISQELKDLTSEHYQQMMISEEKEKNLFIPNKTCKYQKMWIDLYQKFKTKVSGEYKKPQNRSSMVMFYYYLEKYRENYFKEMQKLITDKNFKHPNTQNQINYILNQLSLLSSKQYLDKQKIEKIDSRSEKQFSSVFNSLIQWLICQDKNSYRIKKLDPSFQSLVMTFEKPVEHEYKKDFFQLSKKYY